MKLKMRKNKIVFFFLVYSFFIVISLRKILFIPGVIGHNWDWFVPAQPSYLRHIVQSSFFTWNSISLGRSPILSLPTAPFHSLYASWGYLGLSGYFVSRFLIISTILLAAFSMFFLMQDILRSSGKDRNEIWFPSFLASFFYAFSPFLLCEFIGGGSTQFFSYSFLPLVLLFFRRANSSSGSSKIYIFLTVLFLSALIISLQNFFFGSLILFLYSTFQEKRLNCLKNLIIVYLWCVGLNFYWILPTIFEFVIAKSFVSASEFISLFNINNCVPSLMDIFVATGYARPFYPQLIHPTLTSLWILITYPLIIFILYFNLLKYKTREGLFWTALLLFSFIFATGGKSPLSGLVIWLYKNFFLFNLFRSPQHLMILPSFCFALLLGLGAFNFLKQVRSPRWLRNNKYLLYALTFVPVFIWVHPFILQGDLGQRALFESSRGSNFRGDHIDNYRLSPGYQKVISILEKDKGDYRILFLPMANSPYYLETEYQSEGQGGDPLVIYSPHPAVITDMIPEGHSKKVSLLLEGRIYEMAHSEEIDRILDILNIKYIILRKDVRVNFGPFVKTWNPLHVYCHLKENEDIELIEEYKYVSLWQNYNFLPHIYSSSTSEIITRDIEDLEPMSHTKYLEDKPASLLKQQKSENKGQRIKKN